RKWRDRAVFPGNSPSAHIMEGRPPRPDVEGSSMMRIAAIALLLLTMTGTALGQAPADDTLFEAKVRPVLLASCFKCHGGAKTSGGLRVDARTALVRGGKHGPAIVPGAPEQSLLLQAM